MKQQEIERYYFEMFRKAFPLPPGTIAYSDKPDVILNATRKIGIEITNFYVTGGGSSRSEQVQCKRREDAVSKGQRLYEQSNGKNIELTFGFDKHHPIQDVNALARRIAGLAQRAEGRENGAIRKDVFADIPELAFAHLYARELQYRPQPDPDFPDGEPDSSKGFAAYREYWNRREMRARREGIYRPLQFKAKWKVVQLHRVGPMSKERLRDIVKGKEAKAKHYTTCDAYWLLVVVNFIDPAQDQEIRIPGVDVKSDVFQKLIVYKPYFEHIKEIELHGTRQPASTL